MEGSHNGIAGDCNPFCFCYNSAMKFYPESVVQKARKLKIKGISAREIARRLKVSNGTIGIWCADIPSNNPYHLYIQKLHNQAKRRSIGLINRIKINKENAKILVSILYWCEGAKYPSFNQVSFSNSDVNLVKTFLALFRIGFQPKEKKLRAHLQLHTSHDKEKITSFWSRILAIPRSQFRKPTVTKPTKNMKRKNYRGTCTIRYGNIDILLETVGIYEEFSKKINQIIQK